MAEVEPVQRWGNIVELTATDLEKLDEIKQEQAMLGLTYLEATGYKVLAEPQQDYSPAVFPRLNEAGEELVGALITRITCVKESRAMNENDFIEAWVCDQPPHGSTYQVLREEWIEQSERVIRLIFEIKVNEESSAA